MSQTLPDRVSGTLCGAMVQGPGYLSYRCTRALGHNQVPADDPEPHYAVEIGLSLLAWQAWKERQDNPVIQQQNESEVPSGARLDCPACGGQGTFVVDEIDPKVGVLGTCQNCLASTHLQPPPEDESEDPHVQQPDEVLTEPNFEICPFPTCTVAGLHGHGTDQVYSSGPEHSPVVNALAPTKQREGDQALPQGGGDSVQDRIIADMEESKRVGIERYGSVLKTFNGRRSIQDVHEEVRDLFVYLTQVRMEAEASRDDLVSRVATKIAGASPEQVGGDQIKVAMLAKDMTPLAEIAVDTIMGWVVGQDSGDIEDEVSVVLDSIHSSVHAEDTYEGMARNIVSNLRKVRRGS